jgi:hypothetical protein
MRRLTQGFARISTVHDMIMRAHTILRLCLLEWSHFRARPLMELVGRSVPNSPVAGSTWKWAVLSGRGVGVALSHHKKKHKGTESDNK